MRYLYTLAIAMALLFPSWALAAPTVYNNAILDTGVEHSVTFAASDTDDSAAMRVRGMCSVVFTVEGSDAVSLYSIPDRGTAATSGTLIGAFTADTTTPTVFQAGTKWIKAVATTATTGGSHMVISCSNAQLASTGEGCDSTAGLAPYVGTGGRYKCETDYSYAEADNALNIGKLVVDAADGSNAILMEGNSAYTDDTPTGAQAVLYNKTDGQWYQQNASGVERPIGSRYDMVIERGIQYVDLTNEYGGTASSEASVINRGCMRSFPLAQSDNTVSRSVVDDGTLWAWTVSPADADEFYLTEVLGPGDINLPVPTAVTEVIGTTDTAMTNAAPGALTAGDWGYGDNDTLGFDTVYVFLTATGDPDSQSAGHVKVQNGDIATHPLTTGCATGASGVKPNTVSTLPMDVYIVDVWCTVNVPNLGGATWTSEEVDISEGTTSDWTESVTVPGEWYLEDVGGGVPTGIDALLDQLPTQQTETVLAADALMTRGTLGSLAEGEFAFGDNDAAIAFDTIYLKLTGAGDPNSESSGNITAFYSDQVIFEFDVSNGPVASEYAQLVTTLDFSEDTLIAQWTTPGRNLPLIQPVNAFSSSFFSGGLSPGDIDWVQISILISEIYRKNAWDTLEAQCGMGIQFREPPA